MVANDGRQLLTRVVMKYDVNDVLITPYDVQLVLGQIGLQKFSPTESPHPSQVH